MVQDSPSRSPWSPPAELGSAMVPLAHGLSCKPSAVGVLGGEAKERWEAMPVLKP